MLNDGEPAGDGFVTREIPGLPSSVLVFPGTNLSDAMALAFDAFLTELREEKGVRTVLVDLGPVDYFDDQGLNTLLLGYQAFKKAGGKLALANARDKVYTVLDMMGMTDLFEIYEDVPSAVAALGG